ncbi:MAG TPA: hypothetical protein PKN32_04625 [Bacteroidales bacterium]|nr:hypothetical protein [Bacteroidales bacterium]
MIIVGAGSAGKESSGMLMQDSDEDFVFFDQNYIGDKIWNKYTVITNIEVLEKILKENPYFCVAIGQPRKREKLFNLLIESNAVPKNLISKSANLLSFIPQNGTIIQPGVCISYDVSIGKSCFIHANSVIGHKAEIGDFVNISPLCSIIGPCKIGDYSYIGAGSIVMPNMSLGKNTFITPGSTVNRDIKDCETF